LGVSFYYCSTLEQETKTPLRYWKSLNIQVSEPGFVQMYDPKCTDFEARWRCFAMLARNGVVKTNDTGLTALLEG
jgi:hypothetical protein